MNITLIKTDLKIRNNFPKWTKQKPIKVNNRHKTKTWKYKVYLWLIYSRTDQLNQICPIWLSTKNYLIVTARWKIIINSKVLYKLLNSKKCKKSIYILKIHKKKKLKAQNWHLRVSKKKYGKHRNIDKERKKYLIDIGMKKIEMK